MRKLFVLVLFVSFVSMVWAQDDVRYITTKDFKERIFDFSQNQKWHYLGDKPCVIDFYADWCGPCRRLAPILAELSEDYCDEVIFYKVNVDRERELAGYFRTSSIPMVFFVPMHDAPQYVLGLLAKEELNAIIQEVLLQQDITTEQESED